MKEEVYCIEGMTCAACSSAVERVTRRMEGVERSDVNLTTNKMTIVYQEDRVTPEQISPRSKKPAMGSSPISQSRPRKPLRLSIRKNQPRRSIPRGTTSSGR